MMNKKLNEAAERKEHELKVRENRKVTVKRLQDRESDADIDDALRIGSATEYLEISEAVKSMGESLGDFETEKE